MIPGFRALLFANVALPPDGTAVPAFRPSAYAFFPAGDVDALRLGHLTAQAFVEDLERAVQPALAPGDILLMHTPNNPLLHGLAAWLHRLPQPAPYEACIGLILPPDFRQPDERMESFNRHHYAHAFELLSRLPMRIRYYTETTPMAELFETLGARPMHRNRLPLWVDMASMGQPQRPPDGTTLFYVPGEIRAEKGHAFLINGLLAIAQARPELLQGVRFRFTAAAMPADLMGFLASRPELFEIVPDREISNQRYWELMREADFVVCTYDPRDYRRRSSSIFYEAMAAGIPVLASAGTSMAADLEADGAGAGLAVQYGSADSLAQAIVQASAAPQDFRRRAQSVAAKYQSALSARHFLGWLTRPA